MFTKNSAFLKLTTRRPPLRRKSEIQRTVRAVYHKPPQLFPERNKLLNQGVTRLYWAIRSLQFRLFFRNEEMDASSLDEISRIEPPERPPSIDQLDQLTGHRFSHRWLKYIYNRFKNECPTGKMRFVEFKRLFGGFIPDRLNDGYLERMFAAFCQNSAHPDQLTFQDLVICLSKLCDESPSSSAEWMMRLIGREKGAQIGYRDFHEFVKSIFALRGKSEQIEQKRRAGSVLLGGSGSPTSGRLESCQILRPPTVRSAALLASAITTPTAAPAIANFVPFVGNSKRGSSPDQIAVRAIGKRASLLFKELDAEQKGYLTCADFERFFFSIERKSLIYSS